MSCIGEVSSTTCKGSRFRLPHSIDGAIEAAVDSRSDRPFEKAYQAQVMKSERMGTPGPYQLARR
ncbi:MAG: hypothetical protein CMJ53_08720 [Planctomycetaceae bacterium]|nr:hypothetical protein [Planctomycetaceae bacterium]